jgi:membrane protease YdiL (CAAX protease family)
MMEPSETGQAAAASTYVQPPRRIPNLLHLLLLLAITFAALLLCEGVLIAFHPHAVLKTMQDQRLQVIVNGVMYVIALAVAIPLFPKVWHRSFAEGIRWNVSGANPLLILLGVLLSLIVQGSSNFIPEPKSSPIEQVFTTPGIIWILALFGTFAAPLFEEIVFRGFMLPALALNYDYLSLPKSLEALDAWRASDKMSTAGLLFASIITSLCFAGIHAPQLGGAWAAVALLFGVSLVLCYVRLRFKSVAASTLVHVSYNASIFVVLFVQTGGFRHMEKL